MVIRMFNNPNMVVMVSLHLMQGKYQRPVNGVSCAKTVAIKLYFPYLELNLLCNLCNSRPVSTFMYPIMWVWCTFLHMLAMSQCPHHAMDWVYITTIDMQALEAICKGRLDLALVLQQRGFLPDWYLEHLKQLQRSGVFERHPNDNSTPSAEVYGAIAVNSGAPDEHSHNARIVKAAICAGESVETLELVCS